MFSPKHSWLISSYGPQLPTFTSNALIEATSRRPSPQLLLQRRQEQRQRREEQRQRRQEQRQRRQEQRQRREARRYQAVASLRAQPVSPEQGLPGCSL